MLELAAAPDERTGVDRWQIQRMLALTPAERIDHVTRAHRRLAPFRAAVHR